MPGPKTKNGKKKGGHHKKEPRAQDNFAAAGVAPPKKSSPAKMSAALSKPASRPEGIDERTWKTLRAHLMLRRLPELLRALKLLKRKRSPASVLNFKPDGDNTVLMMYLSLVFDKRNEGHDVMCLLEFVLDAANGANLLITNKNGQYASTSFYADRVKLEGRLTFNLSEMCLTESQNEQVKHWLKAGIESIFLPAIRVDHPELESLEATITEDGVFLLKDPSNPDSHVVVTGYEKGKAVFDASSLGDVVDPTKNSAEVIWTGDATLKGVLTDIHTLVCEKLQCSAAIAEGNVIEAAPLLLSFTYQCEDPKIQPLFEEAFGCNIVVVYAVLKEKYIEADDFAVAAGLLTKLEGVADCLAAQEAADAKVVAEVAALEEDAQRTFSGELRKIKAEMQGGSAAASADDEDFSESEPERDASSPETALRLSSAVFGKFASREEEQGDDAEALADPSKEVPSNFL